MWVSTLQKKISLRIVVERQAASHAKLLISVFVLAQIETFVIPGLLLFFLCRHFEPFSLSFALFFSLSLSFRALFAALFIIATSRKILQLSPTVEAEGIGISS